MNNKAAIGLVAAIIILVGAFFLFNRPVQAPVLMPQTASTTASASSSPNLAPLSGSPTSLAPSAPTPAIHVQTLPQQPSPQPKRIVAVDTASLHAATSRPLITGTANVKTVGYVLEDPAGVGIAGSSDIAVENGHWSFAAPQALSPGVYTLHIIGGDSTLIAKLTVTAS